MLTDQQLYSMLEEGLKEVSLETWTASELELCPIMPSYMVSKYDYLYGYSVEELQSLCVQLGIPVNDCKIRYHYIMRLVDFDRVFNTLPNSQASYPISIREIDGIRNELLSFNGAPGIMSLKEAQELACKYVENRGIHIPISSGVVYVECAGIVRSESSFCTKSCLYPVGYHSVIEYPYIDGVYAMEKYDCWIQEKNNRPLFSITIGDRVLESGHDINAIWSCLQEKIRNQMDRNHIPPKYASLLGMKGEDCFGLREESVQLFLEMQPEALHCKEYYFYYQRKALGSVDAIIDQEQILKSMSDELMREKLSTLLRWKKERVTRIDKQSLKSLANQQYKVIQYQKTIRIQKREEYERREKVWRSMDQCWIDGMQLEKKQEPTEGLKLLNDDSSDLDSCVSSISSSISPSISSSISSSISPILPSAPQLNSLPEKASNSVASGSRTLLLTQPTYHISRGLAHTSQITHSMHPVSSIETAFPDQPPEDALSDDTDSSSSMDVMDLISSPASERVSQPVQKTVYQKGPKMDFCLSNQLELLKSLTPINSSTQRRSESKSHPYVDNHICPSYPSVSILPPDIVGEALSMWDFSVVFARCIQYPPITFSELEAALLFPHHFHYVDELMALTLTAVFSQLKSIILGIEKEQTIHNWRPFLGRRVTEKTWPEFARILFVCKVWHDSGRDAGSFVSIFIDGGKRSIDDVMVKDPFDNIQRITKTSMSDDLDGVLQLLSIHDQACFSRCQAIIMQLKAIQQSALAEKSGSDTHAPITTISKPPMDLQGLEQKMIAGYYCGDGTFHQDSFKHDVDTMCNSCRNSNKDDMAVTDLVISMQEVADTLYRRWMIDCNDTIRGPWSEIAYKNQGCKMCLICNNTDHDDEEPRVRCRQCEVEYHYSCVIPPIEEAPDDEWVCGLCQGRASQEKWADEDGDYDENALEGETIDKGQNNCSIVNPAVFSFLPMRPAINPSNNYHYNYRTLFDSTLLSPVFFGYHVNKLYDSDNAVTVPSKAVESSSTSIYDPSQTKDNLLLQLPYVTRLRRLAQLLSETDPQYMSLKARFAIISSVMTIAKDLPSVHQYINDSMGVIKEVEQAKWAAKTAIMMEIEAILNRMTEMIAYTEKKKEPRKKKAESDGIKPVESTNLMEKRTSTAQPRKEKKVMVYWTTEEMELLRRAVAEFGEGKWKKIATKYGKELAYRSPSSLREKWKGMEGVRKSMKRTLDRVEAGTAPSRKRGKRKQSFTPFTLGDVTVVSLGEIAKKECLYHGSNHLLYPLHFTSCRNYTSMESTTMIPYFFSIEEGPVFQIHNDEGFRMDNSDINVLWKTFMERIHLELDPIDGEVLSGLADPFVQQAIRGKGLATLGKDGTKAEREDDFKCIVASQWHPACIGYLMNRSKSEYNARVINPIFMNCNLNEKGECCDYCHMPLLSTIIKRAVPEVEASLQVYHEKRLELHLEGKAPKLKKMDKDSFCDESRIEDCIRTREYKVHDCCYTLLKNETIALLKRKRYEEEEIVNKYINGYYEMKQHDFNVSNNSMGRDRYGNSYLVFRGDCGRIYVNTNLDEWRVIQQPGEIDKLIRRLDPEIEEEKRLRIVLESRERSLKENMEYYRKSERDVWKNLGSDDLNRIKLYIQQQRVDTTELDALLKSLNNRNCNDATTSVYLINYNKRVETLSVQSVRECPLKALTVFSELYPNAQYWNCHVCGGFILPNLYHCPYCHLEFSLSDKDRVKHEQLCRSHSLQFTNDEDLQLAKYYMQCILVTIPRCMIIKRAQMQWGAVRRAEWVKKVRYANTVYELMSCMFILECITSKAYLTRWYKNSIPSMTSQSSMRTLSALFIRIHSLDESIRYGYTPSEEKSKAGNAIKRGIDAVLGDSEDELIMKAKGRRMKH